MREVIEVKKKTTLEIIDNLVKQVNQLSALRQRVGEDLLRAQGQLVVLNELLEEGE